MFTEENKPLLEEAASIDFQFMKNGAIAYRKHTKHELGLYFIKKAIEKHGNEYGYTKVNYVNNNTKVVLQCKNCGEFEQLPLNHSRGEGCTYCKGHVKRTNASFVKKAQQVHGNIYDYSHTEYINSASPVNIKCRIHGVFTQLANNHIRGSGCPKCAPNNKLTLQDFLIRAVEVHGNQFDYSNVIYLNIDKKVEIICKHSQHGPFLQSAWAHLQGQGCPKCAGKNHNILYLLKCLDTGWYKIGITTNNVEKRVRDIGGDLEEIHHVVLDEPRKHESILHRMYEKDREYNLCVRNGKTEFFSLTEEQVQEVIDYMNEVSSNA